jgi:uncharacterized protein YqjF (DUF2071 family)
MPYEHATMGYRRLGDRFRFEARASSSDARAALTFVPAGEGSCTKERSLDEWLLERYRLFICDRQGMPMSAEVAHPRWVIRSARVSGSADDFGRVIGLDLSPVPDLAHFSEGVKARFGAFRRLECGETATDNRSALLFAETNRKGSSTR